jgi:hypothetical protein
MKSKLFYILFFIFLCGCTGFGVPQPLSGKPWTYLAGGDQIGRDQLANRLMVADLKLPVKDRNKNEILSLLGQPQNILMRERNISEDWYYIYYKKHIPYNPKEKVPFKDKVFLDNPDKGEVVVRFYNDQVIDVVKIS